AIGRTIASADRIIDLSQYSSVQAVH
ncbi:hypothetical protein ACM26X_01955, partial [Kluyvera cryocrescens]